MMHEAAAMNGPPFVQGLFESIEDEARMRRPAHPQPTMGRAHPRRPQAVDALTMQVGHSVGAARADAE